MSMDTKELHSAIRSQLVADKTPSYFSMTLNEESEIQIAANRNGILAFCDLLVESVDESRLKKSSIYEFSRRIF
jgi:hypothetical protein